MVAGTIEQIGMIMMKSKLTQKEVESFMNAIIDKPTLTERIKKKLGIHKHNFIPTGNEHYKGLSEWHVQLVKETKCDICGKISDEFISYRRI